ncbi:MAG: hypothetical protein ACI959_001328, partial [Limisphaerales bacterium]
MRQFLLCLICILFSLSAFGQFSTNEWILHDQNYFKIRITQDGLFKIDSSQLASSLSEGGVLLSAVDPRNFQLFHEGEEQYIHVEGEDDGSFNLDDFIEFYGTKNDGSFDSLLYAEGSLMLHDKNSLFNDTAAYFLTWNTSITNRRIEQRINTLLAAPAPDQYINWLSATYYSNYGSHSQGPTTGEVLSSQYTKGEGFADGVFNKNTINRTLQTENFYFPLSSSSTCRITMIGKGSVTHRNIIDINGLNYIDETWAGYDVRRHEFSLSNLASSNDFTITAAGTDASDQQQLSFIEIKYAHEPFLGGGATRVNFYANDIVSASRLLTLTGFNSATEQPILYDLSTNRRMRGIVSSDTVRFHIDYDATGSHFFLSNALSPNVRNITSMEEMFFTDFSDPINQGNFVILTHPTFQIDTGGTNYVQAYANHRSSLAG